MAHTRPGAGPAMMQPGIESPSRAGAARPVAFLDRDGIINERAAPHKYVLHRGQFRFLPGIAGLLRGLRELGYALVVVTNQQGVGKGLMTQTDLGDLHAWMYERLAAEGVTLTAIYACTHLASDDCRCRKPKPGLIDRAVVELPFRVDLARSVVIGDSTTDIQAGHAAGVGTLVLVGGDAEPLAIPGVLRVAALSDVLAHIRRLRKEHRGVAAA